MKKNIVTMTRVVAVGMAMLTTSQVYAGLFGWASEKTGKAFSAVHRAVLGANGSTTIDADLASLEQGRTDSIAKVKAIAEESSLIQHYQSNADVDLKKAALGNGEALKTALNNKENAAGLGIAAAFVQEKLMKAPTQKVLGNITTNATTLSAKKINNKTELEDAVTDAAKTSMMAVDKAVEKVSQDAITKIEGAVPGLGKMVKDVNDAVMIFDQIQPLTDLVDARVKQLDGISKAAAGVARVEGAAKLQGLQHKLDAAHSTASSVFGTVGALNKASGVTVAQDDIYAD